MTTCMDLGNYTVCGHMSTIVVPTLYDKQHVSHTVVTSLSARDQQYGDKTTSMGPTLW